MHGYCRFRLNLIALKKQYPEYNMILHSDQGSVYASKAFSDHPPMYGITHSMSCAGTPTDNAAKEAINGWIKAELFMNFHITGNEPVEKMHDYIVFFNEQCPAYSLNYLMPKQYHETFAEQRVYCIRCAIPEKTSKPDKQNLIYVEKTLDCLLELQEDNKHFTVNS